MVEATNNNIFEEKAQKAEDLIAQIKAMPDVSSLDSIDAKIKAMDDAFKMMGQALAAKLNMNVDTSSTEKMATQFKQKIASAANRNNRSNSKAPANRNRSTSNKRQAAATTNATKGAASKRFS